MVEITAQAQLFIIIIFFVVFSGLIIKTLKNISSSNENGDIKIDLDKVNERNRKIK